MGGSTHGQGIKTEGSLRDRQKVADRVERSQELAHHKCRNPAPIPDATALRMPMFSRMSSGETDTMRGSGLSHSH